VLLRGSNHDTADGAQIKAAAGFNERRRQDGRAAVSRQTATYRMRWILMAVADTIGVGTVQMRH
jgi:hypothetical protein